LFETARGLLADLVLHGAIPPKYLSMLSHSACTKIPRTSKERDASVADFRIRRAIRHLHDQPDCAVEMLARLAGIGTQHFFERFRACTGLTPRGYANVLKLELALDRVARNDEALSDVSQALGFAHQSHFTRFFRQRIGVNPRAYRSGVAAGRRLAEHL
jgi:AraC-like DNA-binding protein